MEATLSLFEFNQKLTLCQDSLSKVGLKSVMVAKICTELVPINLDAEFVHFSFVIREIIKFGMHFAVQD